MDDGRRVRVCRIAAGWSQHDLARESGLTAWIIGAIERGQRKISNGEMQVIGLALASKLGGDVKSIFPSFIPHTANPPRGGGPSLAAGTRRRDDDR